MEPPHPIQMQAYLDQVRAAIRNHRWAIQGDGDDEPFAYTVGLTAYGHPELLIRGLPHTDAAAVLNHLAHLVVDDGYQLHPDELVRYQPPTVQAGSQPLTLGVDPEPTTDLVIARRVYGPDVQAFRVRPVRYRDDEAAE